VTPHTTAELALSRDKLYFMYTRTANFSRCDAT